MYNPRNNSHSTKSSDHSCQDRGLFVLMTLAGIGQDDKTDLMGRQRLWLPRVSNSRAPRPLSSFWMIPYISFLNDCPSVTWKLTWVLYPSLWIKHLRVCFDFQLRKGKKVGRCRCVGDTEGWLPLTKRPTQDAPVCSVHLLAFSLPGTPPISNQIRSKQKGQQTPQTPWEGWRPRGLADRGHNCDRCCPSSQSSQRATTQRALICSSFFSSGFTACS